MAGEAANRDNDRTITVRIVDTEHGVREYDKVNMVHVKSRYYNILIMEGYSSSIGEVEGDVTVTSATMQKTFSQVKGFYLHKNNTFHLLVKEELHVE
jgi:hypothetical protein